MRCLSDGRLLAGDTIFESSFRMVPVELATLESAKVMLWLNNPFVPSSDTTITRVTTALRPELDIPFAIEL